MKTCTKCGIEKPFVAFPSRENQCKECKKAYHKRYYGEHKEVFLINARNYFKQNPGYMAKWNQENPEYRKQYTQAHRAELKAYLKKFHQERPEFAKSYDAKRRTAEGTFTGKDFIRLCETTGWICTYCGCELTLRSVTADHYIPLVKGGTNYIENIVPSCLPCNLSKGAKIL